MEEGATHSPSQDDRERLRDAKWECLGADDPIMVEIDRRIQAANALKQTQTPVLFRLALSNVVHPATSNIWTESGRQCEYQPNFARGGMGFRVSPTLPRVAAEVESVADDLEELLGRLMTEWIDYPAHRYDRDSFAFSFTLWHTPEMPGHLILLYMYRVPDC